MLLSESENNVNFYLQWENKNSFHSPCITAIVGGKCENVKKKSLCRVKSATSFLDYSQITVMTAIYQHTTGTLFTYVQCVFFPYIFFLQHFLSSLRQINTTNVTCIFIKQNVFFFSLAFILSFWKLKFMSVT